MKTLDTVKDQVEQIFSSVRFPSDPCGLYDPLRYMMQIGGKRIRPTLCLLSYSLFKDDFPDQVRYPAEALEVFHTFTLIHDDIMDRSALRRGKTTVWKKWSEDTAILSGDVMLIEAYKRMSYVPRECFREALELFSATAAQVCEGQQYDMDFERREDVSMPEYEAMIGLKTAVLLACSAKMGALIAGAGADECDALYEYAYQLGLAFQVCDDYLDAFGDEKVFGKPIGGDIMQQKKSWLTIRGFEVSEDKEEFVRVFRSRDVEKVKAEYKRLGVDSDAIEKIKDYNDRAILSLENAHFAPESMDALKEFADSLVGRVK